MSTGRGWVVGVSVSVGNGVSLGADVGTNVAVSDGRVRVVGVSVAVDVAVSLGISRVLTTSASVALGARSARSVAAVAR